MKNKKQNKIDVKAYILAGALVVFVLTGFFLLGRKIAMDNSLFHTPIEPAYYHEEDFKKPPEITIYEKKVSEIKLPIIMYHYVEYVKDPKDTIRKSLDVTPYSFEKQLATLKNNGYQTYFVKDIPDILAGKTIVSSRSAILTFDDGYEDFYTDAFPLLKKYQLKGTIYIVYNFIGRHGFMNEKELKEVIASGLVELGSHTLDHLSLKSLPTMFAKKQIFDSKALLEKMFGITVDSFAYPYGTFNKSVEDLVRQAGYRDAVSVISGKTQSQNNLYYLSRIRAGYFEGSNMVNLLQK